LKGPKLRAGELLAERGCKSFSGLENEDMAIPRCAAEINFALFEQMSVGVNRQGTRVHL